MDKEGIRRQGPSEEARRVTGEVPGQGKKRFTGGPKVEIVLRLLRGKVPELSSRELGVTAAKPSKWREQFLSAERAGLKKYPQDARELSSPRIKLFPGKSFQLLP